MAEVKAPTRSTGARVGAVSASTPPPPICSVAFCPICTVVTALGEVRPDLMEHLLMAGREVLLGVRALIDARLEGSESTPTKMEHLTIE
jgi:hypothetical protein